MKCGFKEKCLLAKILLSTHGELVLEIIYVLFLLQTGMKNIILRWPTTATAKAKRLRQKQKSHAKETNDKNLGKIEGLIFIIDW